MLRFVTIDLSNADLAAFEGYEDQVLRLLPDHGGRIEMRVRAVDGQSEIHLLAFPDEAAFENYHSDPRRLALVELWEMSGARSSATLVSYVPR